MINDYLSHYPSSYLYHEVIDKVGKVGGVACCYIGDNIGRIIFRDDIGDVKVLIPDKVQNIDIDSKKYELWSFISDLELDNPVNKSIMNMLFNTYCEYYHYLNENNVDLFSYNNQGGEY